MEGHLAKMVTSHQDTVQYQLPMGEQLFPLNSLIGKNIKLSYLGEIRCVNCGKLTKKSWQQGYCYPCTLKLAECDMCILKPELCHYAQGTCRDPQWGEDHCMKPHVVYLANSSGLKVGITRLTQVPTRWMDQGAIQALPVCQVENRLTSGQLERLIGEHVADKTQWQKLIKEDAAPMDLLEHKKRLMGEVKNALSQFKLSDIPEKIYEFKYPVLRYPEKAKSLTLEKNPTIEGELIGIKGQYLLFTTGAMNVRNHAGHLVRIEVLS